MSGTVVAAPRRAHHAPLSQAKTLQDAFEHPEFMSRIKDAVPAHMNPKRMLSTFVLSVRKQPKLMKVDIMSFLGACIGLSTVGLEPNTPLGHAYLIPFDEKKWNPKTRTSEVIRTNVQVIFGYQGLLDLTYRSGQMRSVHADVVWRGDEFDYHYGSGGQLRHKPMGAEVGEDELPLHAYMYASMKGDAENFEVMPMRSVLRIRNETQAYRGAVAARDNAIEKKWKVPATYTETPWVKHFVPMARKTVFRAGQKWLPKSIELAAALAWDELQDKRNPNYGAVIDGSADVLDGGLTALEDETGGIPDMDLSTSPQDDREPVPVPHRPGSAPSTTVQVKLPEWLGYLVDEQGEMVGEEAFADPVAFAKALGKLWKESDTKLAVLAANVDYVADAKKASSSARAIIEDLERLTPQPGIPRDDLLQNSASQPTSESAESSDAAAAPVAVPVPVPQDRRGPAWPPYVKAIRVALQTVGKTELPKWVALNLPTIQAAPDVHRLMVIKIVGEHAAALGLEQPAGLAAAVESTRPAENAAPTVDRDKQWTDELVADLADAPTAAALDGFLAAHVVTIQRKRLATERPELAQIIDATETERRQQLTDPPLDPDEGFPGDKFRDDLRR